LKFKEALLGEIIFQLNYAYELTRLSLNNLFYDLIIKAFELTTFFKEIEFLPLTLIFLPLKL